MSFYYSCKSYVDSYHFVFTRLLQFETSDAPSLPEEKKTLTSKLLFKSTFKLNSQAPKRNLLSRGQPIGRYNLVGVAGIVGYEEPSIPMLERVTGGQR